MAATGTSTRMYWLITVKDAGDLAAGVFPYERRFEFSDLEEAFQCAKGAQEAGFDVSASKVVATKNGTAAASVVS
jgi:hypothetical protein